MHRTRCAALAAVLLSLTALTTLPVLPAQAQKDVPNAQSRAAAKNVAFGKIIATDSRVMSATKANDLAKARTLVGKTAALQGTVTKVFAPRNGDLVILNFDKDYRKALTAVVRKHNFAKFPDLRTLEGKKVLVTGKVVDYKGQPEIELAALTDVKLVP